MRGGITHKFGLEESIRAKQKPRGKSPRLLLAARVRAPTAGLRLRLANAERRGDVVEHALNFTTERGQSHDREDRNENDDQRILDQTLALFLALELRQPGHN